MLCSLFTTFFYQNCSEIENTEAKVERAEFSYLPLYTQELKIISSVQKGTDCTKISEVLYSEAYNLCFEVSDSCGFEVLIDKGFSVIDRSLDQINTAEMASSEATSPSLEDRVKSCQIFVDITDLKPNDFLPISAYEANYKPDPELMCSQSLESLISFKSRTCVVATDGCQSQFLKKSGYVKDHFSLCPDQI